MKIFVLNSSRGQKAMKGTTIHFAQHVQEVANVLPDPQNASDIFIIIETFEYSSHFLQMILSLKI